MNKTHDCNWCAMTSCGTTVILKPHSVDPATVQADPATAQVDPATAQVDPATVQADPATAQVDPATAQVDPATVQVDPATAHVDPTTAHVDPATAQVEPAPAQVEASSGSLIRINVQLNPTVVPAKFTRYRHPSHCHRLFMIISFGHNYCNNKNCNINIKCNKTMFRCYRCDYDLCGNCFQLGTKGDPVPLAPDDNDVDETTINPITSWFVDPAY